MDGLLKKKKFGKNKKDLYSRNQKGGEGKNIRVFQQETKKNGLPRRKRTARLAT